MRWFRTRAKRALAVFLALLLYGALLLVSAQYTFLHNRTSSSLFLWGSFGFSAFTGLIFLAIGSLVWIYLKERRVAFALFSLCFTMMMALVIKDAALLENTFGMFSTLSEISSFYALGLLSWLLLLFPRNYLTPPIKKKTEHSPTPSSPHVLPPATCWLRVYIISIFVIATFLASYSLYLYITGKSITVLFASLALPYTSISLLGALITIGLTYKHSTSLRERQQLRLFTGGVILTVAPFLFLTVLPEAFHMSYYVDARISTVTFVLFPLSLGYSILRYQVLVFDSYVRTAVAWMVGMVCLAVLSYVVIAICSFITVGKPTFYVILVASITAFCAPSAWWLARLITEYLFFNELFHYRRLLNKPSALNNASLDLEEATRLLTLAATRTFETQEVCLFVLSEESGQYTLYPTIQDETKEEARHLLLARVTKSLSYNPSVEIDLQNTIDAHHPMLARIQASSRPLLLGEVSRARPTSSGGISRYLNTHSEDDYGNTLIAPVRVQGKMIGLLVLGNRGNQEQYAGPDFEIAQLLLDRYVTVLETARLYRQAKLSAQLQNSLYHASMLPNTIFQTVGALAVAYAQTASEAINGNAEIWLYHAEKKILRRTRPSERHIPFLPQEIIHPEDSDWQAYFFSVSRKEQTHTETTTTFPACFASTPQTPFVWLPLHKGEEHLGIIIIAYSHMHIFSEEEQRIWQMFAHQCAISLENMRITIALRAAYERQKELDALKDQFIVTASHELRTPLTAVQGYIELLKEHDNVLSPELRARFVERAHRGCDELTLMVGNIMDASRVHIDAENIHLTHVVLLDTVHHITEIIDSILRNEQRVMRINIAPELQVVADDLRLRQILLNLVSNAQKYSAVGTPIEIAARQEGQMIKVAIRDYGAGIPPEEHERLFERFVRMERDMNSPVRGAGLGLYICRKLTRAMGGDIWIESTGEAGKGSTFFFTLKAVEQPLPSIVNDVSHSSSPA